VGEGPIIRLQGLCRNTGSSLHNPLTTVARLGHTHRTADPLPTHLLAPFQHFLCPTHLTTELLFHHPLSRRKVWRTCLTMRLNPESRNYTFHTVREIMKTKNLPGVITFGLWVSEWVGESNLIAIITGILRLRYSMVGGDITPVSMECLSDIRCQHFERDNTVLRFR